jgi:hypothetical protein
MDSHNHDNIDILLDQAFHSYSAAEPRPGLEARVMARVQAQGQTRRSWWRPLIFAAVPVVAGIVFVVVSTRLQSPRHNDPRPAVSLSQPPAVAVSAPDAQRPAKTRFREGVRRVRRGVAPAMPIGAAPVTEEERALAAFAARYPDEIPRVQAHWSAEEKPLEFGQLKIEPLSITN